jgi:hypothetical protein
MIVPIKRLLPFLVIFPCLIFPNQSVKAVTIAGDNVYLYESGKEITSDAIYLVSYKSWSDRCHSGLCSIGQQFYPVTIYLPKSEKLLTEPEFSSQYPYSGPEYGSEAGKAKDEWSAKNTSNYLEYLDKNSRTSVAFNPGPSQGGEGCGYPGCMGGRIGNSRTFTLDVSSGKFSERNSTITLSSGFGSFLRQFFESLSLFLTGIFSK